MSEHRHEFVGASGLEKQTCLLLETGFVRKPTGSLGEIVPWPGPEADQRVWALEQMFPGVKGQDPQGHLGTVYTG